jgi:hypothetical protein
VSEYFGEFGTQAAHIGGRVGEALASLLSTAVIIFTLVAAVGAIGGAKVIHADQATSLALFSGKAATAADTAIIKQITTCGKVSGTVLAVQWSGPPLRVTSDTLGTNKSLSAPGPGGQSEASCLASDAANLKAGPTAQSCPSVALQSGGSSTANTRAFVEQYVACESVVGAS